MAGELTKKQISVAKKDATAAIDMYKADIRERLKEFRGISTLVATAHRAYCDAGIQNEKKPSVKGEKKLARAYESFTYAKDNYVKASAKLNSIAGLIEEEYSKLIELCRMQGNLKAADRVGAEFEEYRESYLRQLEKSDKSAGLGVDAVMDTEESEVKENLQTELPTEEPASLTSPAMPVASATPTAAPLTPKAVNSTVTSVNVAPVTIDVTPIVEKAITTAIDKLSEGLNRKLEAYINNLTVPTPIIASEPVAQASGSGLDVDALDGVLQEESIVLEKLKALCTSLSGLIVELGEVSSECMAITQKQKELAELQKQINDIQRHTLREQQGVQVTQRLVSEEQVELIAAQALVAENQKQLSEKQTDIANAQSAAVATEGELMDAVSNLSKENGEIVEKHRQLIAGAEKQNALLLELTERSREIYAEQKNALSATKKLLRDQQKLKD